MLDANTGTWRQVVHVTSRSFNELGELLMAGLDIKPDSAIQISCRNGIDVLAVNVLWVGDLMDRLAGILKRRALGKNYVVLNDSCLRCWSFVKGDRALFPRLDATTFGHVSIDADAVLVNERGGAVVGACLLMSEALTDALSKLELEISMIERIEAGTGNMSELDALSVLKAA